MKKNVFTRCKAKGKIAIPSLKVYVTQQQFQELALTWRTVLTMTSLNKTGLKQIPKAFRCSTEK